MKYLEKIYTKVGCFFVDTTACVYYRFRNRRPR